MDQPLELVIQALRISVPYTLAALAGTLSERSGVVNIALEGTLLVGAFGCVVGTLSTGSPLLGLICGLVVGALMGGIHALVTTIAKADHIVSGIALNLLAVGATRVLLQRWYHSASNSPRMEGIGPFVDEPSFVAFLTHPLVWLTVLLIGAVWWLFARSVFGFRISAVGEDPHAAASAGLSTRWLRIQAVMLSGALAGLGGVWLACDQHQYSDGMSGGRGYIALAAMVFGRWRPVPSVLACLLFGVAETVQIRLQGGAGLPVQLVQTLPYVLTLGALCTAGKWGEKRGGIEGEASGAGASQARTSQQHLPPGPPAALGHDLVD